MPIVLLFVSLGLFVSTVVLSRTIYDGPLLILPVLLGFILLIVVWVKSMKIPQEPKRAASSRKFPIFPPVVKWVGFAVALAGLVLLFVLKDRDMYAVMVLGLWAAAMSRDRVEDEMLLQVRLSSVFMAFAWVSGMSIFWQLTDGDFPIAAGVVSMLLFYHLAFWGMKSRIRRGR